jgi:hypothetical protein
MDRVEETRIPSRMMRELFTFEGESDVTEVGFAAGLAHKYRVYREEEGSGHRYVVMQWPNRSDAYLLNSWLADSWDREVAVEVYYPDRREEPRAGETLTWLAAMSRAVALALKDMRDNR